VSVTILQTIGNGILMIVVGVVIVVLEFTLKVPQTELLFVRLADISLILNMLNQVTNQPEEALIG